MFIDYQSLIDIPKIPTNAQINLSKRMNDYLDISIRNKHDLVDTTIHWCLMLPDSIQRSVPWRTMGHIKQHINIIYL